MTTIKQKGIELDNLVINLSSMGTKVDQRWVAIGKTDSQTGLMALTRAVVARTTN